MKNYEKLKQIIIKANPSILELKFGCEVEVEKEKGFILQKYPISPPLLNEQSTYDIWLRDACGVVERYKSWFKILGRPIRLADILLAIQKQEKDNKNKWTNKSQISLLEESIKLLFTDKIKWDLTKDLDNQSDETKQFLQDILL